jgi:hypothetical protein
VHGFLRESGNGNDVYNSVSVSTYHEHKEHTPEVHTSVHVPHQEVWPIHDEYGPPAQEYGPPHEEYAPPVVPEVRLEEPTTTTEQYA